MNDLKLHLGCGKRYLPGYKHVDLSSYEHVDYCCSVDKLDMIENDSVSVIYASHVLEYFTDAESFRVLHEWRNKLKTGGILRLAVPNFLALIEVYQQTSSLELISGPILGIWRVSEEKYIQHKALYNFRKLADRLYHIGFIAVREWNWREVFVDELKDFDDYSQAYVPHMNKEHGKLISLNIEAIK